MRALVFSGGNASMRLAAAQEGFEALSGMFGYPNPETKTDRYSRIWRNDAGDYALVVDHLVEALDGQTFTFTRKNKSYQVTISYDEATGVVTAVVNGKSFSTTLVTLDSTWTVEPDPA